MSAGPIALAIVLAAGRGEGARPGPPLDAGQPRPAAPALAPGEADRIVRLRFGWSAPLRARVTYRSTSVRPGARRSFTASYEARVDEDGDGLRMTARGTTWRGDLPVPRRLAREAIRASERVVQRIGRDGRFAGLEGVEALGPVVAASLDPQAAPADGGGVERALPVALAAMRGEAEEAWNVVVGFWTGADLALGETYVLEAHGELPLLRGAPAAQSVEFGVRRRVPCSPRERELRCVEATLRAIPDRAALGRAAAALLDRLLPPGAARGEADAGDLSAECELSLVTDPATLLPRRVVWTKTVRLGAVEDGPPRAELVERSEWEYRYLPPEPKRARPGATAARAEGVPAAAAQGSSPEPSGG